MNHSVLQFFATYGSFMLAGAAIVEGALAAVLLRQIRKLKHHLRRAQEAAEDAARAAALAAPGNIDPEVVIHLLHAGQAPTLDNVNALMEYRERMSQGQP